MNSLELSKRCSVTENKKGETFVGIIYSENSAKVIFPLGYKLPEDDNECRKSILNLLNAISKSKNIINRRIQVNDQLNDDPEFPVSAYVWLINDYFKNGVYKAKENISKNTPQGKTNWPKTLHTKPLIDGDTVVYLNPITNHSRYTDDYITEIHLLCLSEAFNHLGWLFGNYNIQQSMFNMEHKDYAISLLNKEYFKTYDDRKKRLIVQMKNVLLGLNDKSDRSTLNNYGIENFEYVWEIILAKMFGNVDVTKYYPQATWHINGMKDMPDSRLRPDIILKRKNDHKAYVLDAKYYRFGDTVQKDDAIPTSSIQKQIVYGQYVSKVSGSTTFNAFLVPYNKYSHMKLGKELKENIEFVGYADVDWESTKKIQSYDCIALIFIDTKFVIDNWSDGINESLINDLCSKISYLEPVLKNKGWIIQES